jgi:hypothetical protein
MHWEGAPQLEVHVIPVLLDIVEGVALVGVCRHQLPLQGGALIHTKRLHQLAVGLQRYWLGDGLDALEVAVERSVEVGNRQAGQAKMVGRVQLVKTIPGGSRTPR